MRCEWITPNGQCKCEATQGKFCDQHGHISAKEGLRHYLITNRLVGDSADRHCAANEIKDLRDEISLTRALIETRLNLAQEDAEVIASMGILHQYLTTVEKLVSACHRMDTNLGNLLNKASVLSLAQELVNIISEELGDLPNRDEIVDRITSKIVESIAKANND